MLSRNYEVGSMGVGAGLYMYVVVVKSSRSLSHLLMSSCSLCNKVDEWCRPIKHDTHYPQIRPHTARLYGRMYG